MIGPRRRRILVVDDHDVVHWGFRLLFTNQSWVERCLSAKTGDEAVELAVRYEPHVALVDLFVGAESGAEICTRVRERSPQTRVLLISGAGRITPSVAKAAGASGFVSKDASGQEVARAAQLVSMGTLVFPPQSAEARRPASPSASARCSRWWPRARPTVRSRRSCTSPRTPSRSTRARCIASSAFANRAEAVQRAQRLGLLT